MTASHHVNPLFVFNFFPATAVIHSTEFTKGTVRLNLSLKALPLNTKPYTFVSKQNFTVNMYGPLARCFGAFVAKEQLSNILFGDTMLPTIE